MFSLHIAADEIVHAASTEVVPAGAKIEQLMSSGPSDIMQCRHRLQLYQAMCRNDSTLLTYAAEVFGDMPPLLQEAFISEVLR